MFKCERCGKKEVIRTTSYGNDKEKKREQDSCLACGWQVNKKYLSTNELEVLKQHYEGITM